jgi:hypothetical protein
LVTRVRQCLAESGLVVSEFGNDAADLVEALVEQCARDAARSLPVVGGGEDLGHLVPAAVRGAVPRR